MANSLCVLAPVQNAQRSLSNLLTAFLDMLPELTPQWRILVQDHGSRDATSEIAAEFISLYPQIQWVSLSANSSATDDWRTGLIGSSEEILLYRAIDCRGDLRDLDKIWRLAANAPIVAGRVGGALGSIPLVPGRRSTVSLHDTDIVLTRRSVWNAWPTSPASSAWNYLRETNSPTATLEMRQAPPPFADVPSREQESSRAGRHPAVRRVPAIPPLGGAWFSRLKRIQAP